MWKENRLYYKWKVNEKGKYYNNELIFIGKYKYGKRNRKE